VNLGGPSLMSATGSGAGKIAPEESSATKKLDEQGSRHSHQNWPPWRFLS
jgi:hypothetical protein